MSLKSILKDIYNFFFKVNLDYQQLEENKKTNQLKAMGHQGFLL